MSEIINPRNTYQSVKRRKHALHGFMAVCEQNYHRLLKLIPELNSDQCIRRDFSVEQGNGEGPSAKVCFEITEQCRYTSMVSFHQQSIFLKWLPKPTLSIRVYHDACMAEVISYQYHRNIMMKQSYPNPNMYQVDEKLQWNRFLDEWLTYCLANGLSE